MMKLISYWDEHELKKYNENFLILQWWWEGEQDKKKQKV